MRRPELETALLGVPGVVGARVDAVTSGLPVAGRSLAIRIAVADPDAAGVVVRDAVAALWRATGGELGGTIEVRVGDVESGATIPPRSIQSRLELPVVGTELLLRAELLRPALGAL